MTSEEKNKFAEENMELVYYVANKFKNTGHQYDDLVGIGMIGFTKALNTYQKDKNTKISTYSVSCIRNEILHFLRKEKKHIINNVSSETVIYEHSEGKTIFLLDVLSDDEEETERRVILKENVRELLDEIDELPEREQEIIKYRFGLDGRKKLKQREIGKMLGMTQANVSKLESGIIEKLLDSLKDKQMNAHVK